jgi:hypothetical protein
MTEPKFRWISWEERLENRKRRLATEPYFEALASCGDRADLELMAAVRGYSDRWVQHVLDARRRAGIDEPTRYEEHE